MAVKTEKIILDLRAELSKAKKDMKDLKGGVSGVNKEVGKTTALLKKVGGAFAAYFSIGMIKSAVQDMIALNMEFEKTITNVMTLMDKTTKAKFGEFISEGALRTMAQFGLEVSDVNKALFDTISAGIKARDSIKFLNEAAKLAVGGVTNLSTAVDGMTSVMNAYKLSIEDANKVASAFFTAQKFGKTTVAELAQNIGMVAPVAKMAGISFQEVLSVLALLTKQGIQTDIATTALRATIVALTSPTKASAAEFKKLGIETGITAIQEVGLAETLLKVAKATKIHKDKMTELIPNVRALVGVAALGEQALIEYDEILKEVNTDTGETSSLTIALKEQMATMEKQLDKTKGAWREFRIEFWDKMIKESQKFKDYQVALYGTGMLLMALTDIMRGTEKAAAAAAKETQKFFELEKPLPWVTGEKKVEIKEEEEKIIDNLEKQLKKIRKEYALTKADVEEEIGVEPWMLFGALSDLLEFDLKEELEGKADLVAEFDKKMFNFSGKLRQESLEDIRANAQAEIQIERYKQETKLAIIGGAFGLARGLAGENFVVQKLLAIAESIISTFLSAQLAYQSMAWIPGTGPALAKAAKTNAIIGGLANTAMIVGVTLAGLEEGGFTGKSKIPFVDSKGKRIAYFGHEDEFVFNKEKTAVLRPFFEDIHHDRIDIKGLATLTRRGVMTPIINSKLNADILEKEVRKIYQKMSEEKDNSSEISFDGGIMKRRGLVTTIIK